MSKKLVIDYLLKRNRKQIEVMQLRIKQEENNLRLIEELLNELRDEELLALLLYKRGSRAGGIFTGLEEGSTCFDVDSNLYKELKNYVNKRTINDLRELHPFCTEKRIGLCARLEQCRKMLQTININQAYEVIQALSPEENEDEFPF
jgi:hypothetical protein